MQQDTRMLLGAALVIVSLTGLVVVAVWLLLRRMAKGSESKPPDAVRDAAATPASTPTEPIPASPNPAAPPHLPRWPPASTAHPMKALRALAIVALFWLGLGNVLLPILIPVYYGYSSIWPPLMLFIGLGVAIWDLRPSSRALRALAIVALFWLGLGSVLLPILIPVYYPGYSSIWPPLMFFIGVGVSIWYLRPSIPMPAVDRVVWTQSGESPAPAAGRMTGPPISSTKVCPDCAETVLAEARICRFCRFEFPALPPPEAPAEAPAPVVYEFESATSQPTRSTPARPVEVAMTDSRPEVIAMGEDSNPSAPEATIAEKSHNPRLRSGKYLIGGAIVVLLGLAVASGLRNSAGPTTYTDFRAHYSAVSIPNNPYMTEEQARQFTSGWVTWLDTHPPEPCYSALHSDLRAFYSALQEQPMAVFADDTLLASFLPASMREDLLSAAATCKS